MSDSERVRMLDSAVRGVLAPALEAAGFSADRRRRCFRRARGDCLHIVELQLGQRGLAGRFCVNLGVYHPRFHHLASHCDGPGRARVVDCLYDFQLRLGRLRPPLHRRLLSRLLPGAARPAGQGVPSGPDRWWPFGGSEARTRRSVQQMLDLLQAEGLGWLDSHSDPRALEASHEAVQRKMAATGGKTE